MHIKFSVILTCMTLCYHYLPYFCFSFIYIALRILVLPNQILQVSWEPADDARRSVINYVINTTTLDMQFLDSISTENHITMATLTRLPQYSSGTVSVWANNSGGQSECVTLDFRMANIVTNGRHMQCAQQ